MSKEEKTKLSMADLASQIRNTFKDKEQSKIVCTGAEIPRLEKKDFIILPEWWKEVTGLWGLPYGYIFMIAGNKDCHAKGQGILMHDGTVKKVEDIQVGEKLMGHDSTPRTVLELKRGIDTMYNIIPTNGDPFTVNENHILSLELSPDKNYEVWRKDRNKYYYPYKNKDQTLNITLKDFLKKSDTFKNMHLLYRRGVEFENPHTDFLINPYLMGVWLGDGTSGKFSITTMDKEIKDEFISVVESKGGKVRVEVLKNNKSNVYNSSFGRAKGIIRGEYANPFNKELASLGVRNNKHIPHKYLTSTKENRLALLAGLIDSDGYSYKNSPGCEIVQKRKVLADNIAYLCRSLGLAAYVYEVRKECVNTGVWGTYYKIGISGNLEEIPTRLKRKKFEPRADKMGNKNMKSVLRTGFKVEKAQVDNYYGFKLSGDRLYLLDDFTVSHNSGKTAVSIEIIKTAQKQGVYVVLVDTEKKTDRDRLTFHGVKDDELAVIRPSYLEEAYDGIDKWIDAINASDPEAKILVVFDSLGNTPSKKEKDTQLDSTHQLGVAAKVNKLALRRLTPQLGKNNVHFLVINQTYQNMGSFGRSNSGGQAVDFAAAVIYQTSRAAWLEKGTGANTKRVGAQVKWTLYKSQLGFKKEGFIKSFKLNLTNDGVALVKDRKEKEDDKNGRSN